MVHLESVSPPGMALDLQREKICYTAISKNFLVQYLSKLDLSLCHQVQEEEKLPTQHQQRNRP